MNLNRNDNDDSDASGRSTPEHLKNININIQSDDDDEAPTKTTKKTRTFSETLKMLDDDILADLVTLHSDVNSNIQFQLDSAKSGYGCSWSDVTNSCVHGLSYPFTATILDLDQVSSSVTNVTKQNGPGTKVHMLWC